MFGDLAVLRDWKARSASGEPWPRIVGAGHILDGPRPVWPQSVVAANAEEARRAVDSLHAAGADFIKVYSKLPHDAFVAALEEAKHVGTYAVGHVPLSTTVAEASDKGMRSIEHLTGVAIDCSRDAAAIRADGVARMNEMGNAAPVAVQADRILATQDSATCAALIAHLARNHTWQTPTLTVLRSNANRDDAQFTNDPRKRYMPPAVIQSWRTGNGPLRVRTPEGFASARRLFQRDLELVRAMNTAGVPILAGTDVLNPYVFPGFSLHDELALLVDAGLSPAGALRAATLNPAIFLNTTDSLGTIEQGKRADLVLLDANPLADIHNTQKIRVVVLNGRLYERAALEEMLAKAEESASKVKR
jgi:imidazolonepropionase-like amidohydrolase